MFDWFKKLFDGSGTGVPAQTFPRNNANGGMGGIDPEAGVPAGQDTGIGRIQGWNEGTGEGAWQNMTKKDYGDLGRAFQAQQVPNLIQGGLNVGFNQNWLGQQTNSGSANGAKIS